MRENLLKNAALVVTVLALMAGSFIVGTKTGGKNNLAQVPASLMNVEEGKMTSVDFSPFWKVWNILEEKYVSSSATSTEEVTDQEKLWGAIEGLAHSLGDPYTVFFPPVESERFQEEVSGNFQGIGIEIGLRDGVLTVIAPLKGTPAEEAGLKAGDKIIKIDDVLTGSITIDESIGLIRGEKGTVVVLTVDREGIDEPLEIPVKRDIINVPNLDWRIENRGGERVFVIELYNFSANSVSAFRGALREFIKARTDKLILDLRGNPGGYLDAAIDISSWFLAPGKVVAREDFGQGRDEVVYRSKGYDIFNDRLKMAILVDEGSASASEIVAGALQSHKRATLVGTRTFGKGSVQELVDITPETTLKVTIARWLTPDGISISEGGLKPDAEVSFVEGDQDNQFEKALEILLTK